MPLGLKSNNKIKIILFLLGGMIFILIGAGFFGLVQKVFAGDTYTYDFSSEPGIDKWGYKKSGVSWPASPTDYTSTANSGDYTNISSSDDARWEVDDATGNFWDSQIYTFEITEDISFITKLALEWEGYGNYGETCPGYDTYFYIWKAIANSWEEIDVQNTPGGDVILEGDITANIADYIDSENNNNLTLMTSTQRGKLLGESCGGNNECCSGYCADGVCCDKSCGGDCQVCNLAGNVGACIPRGINDTTEITRQCYYCNGYSAWSQPYSGDNGFNCANDCTRCDNGICKTRSANDNIEVTKQCYYCNGYSASSRPYSGLDGVNCTNNCTYCENGSCRGRGISDGTECSTCKACDASGHCSDVLTENTDTDTGWGFNYYGCVGANKRCYKGVCRTCGGYVYDDGCANCAGQGGKACWRTSTTFLLFYALSCDEYCALNGGCVQANWNDNVNCAVCRHWWPNASCVAFSQSFDPIYRNPGWANTCNYRLPGYNQSCSQRGDEGYSARFCVCNY